VLENKSDNISELCKDRGKVTMEGLKELTNALSNSTIPDFLRPAIPQDCEFATHPKIPVAVIPGTDKATNFKFWTHIHSINRKKSPLKISGPVAVDVVRDSQNFSGHSYIQPTTRLSLR